MQNLLEDVVATSDEPGKTYIENFDKGSGGWFDVISNREPVSQLEIQNGIVVSRSPWWVDYNHAPPGGGYLHLIMGLMTSETDRTFKQVERVVGENGFTQGDFPTDFVDAKLTVRLKGKLDLRGAQLCLLIQGTVEGICSGWALTGQPIKIAEDWSETTITAVFDIRQWTSLGSRHDRTETYGEIPLDTILANVNTNIYLVLFPLNVLPQNSIQGDPHTLRAGLDYAVDRSKLPEGNVMIDRIKITFSE